MLPIGGAQHVQAFCHLFQGVTARAVCSGCFSHQSPAAGPRQCCAVGVHLTKALLWGLDSALRGGGGGVGMSPGICCARLQPAAPIGRSPFAALPFSFLDEGPPKPLFWSAISVSPSAASRVDQNIKDSYGLALHLLEDAAEGGGGDVRDPTAQISGKSRGSKISHPFGALASPG